jgi:hypothetical protein
MDKRISYYLLSENDCLTLEILEGVKVLNCKLLEGLSLGDCAKLIIPSTLMQIDVAVWEKFTALQEIFVRPQSEHFASDAGVLYSKDHKALVKYPAAKQDTYFEIPSEVTNICESAFLHATNLACVKVGSSVTTIEEFAFFNALGLRHIYISKSVTNIRGKYIFGTKDEQQIFLCEWYLVVGGETGSELEKWCDRYGVNFYPLQEKELRDFLALPLPELHPYPAGKDTYLAGSRKIAQEKENAKRQKQ